MVLLKPMLTYAHTYAHALRTPIRAQRGKKNTISSPHGQLSYVHTWVCVARKYMCGKKTHNSVKGGCVCGSVAPAVMSNQEIRVRMAHILSHASTYTTHCVAAHHTSKYCAQKKHTASKHICPSLCSLIFEKCTHHNLVRRGEAV